jgi:hypothetical protein
MGVVNSLPFAGVKSFEISNGHKSVIKRLRAMNLAPLDSSRQAASFETKIFEN